MHTKRLCGIRDVFLTSINVLNQPTSQIPQKALAINILPSVILSVKMHSDLFLLYVCVNSKYDNCGPASVCVKLSSLKLNNYLQCELGILASEIRE